MDDTQGNGKAIIIYQLESGLDHTMEWSFYQQIQQSFCKIKDRRAIDFIHIDANRQPLKEVGLQTRSAFYKIFNNDSILFAQLFTPARKCIQ